MFPMSQKQKDSTGGAGSATGKRCCGQCADFNRNAHACERFPVMGYLTLDYDVCDMFERIRDTGWQALPTSHGTRYHRERGGTQLDVEMQVTTWVASVISDGVLAKVERGHATAAAAATVIETYADVLHMPLPKEAQG